MVVKTNVDTAVSSVINAGYVSKQADALDSLTQGELRLARAKLVNIGYDEDLIGKISDKTRKTYSYTEAQALELINSQKQSKFDGNIAEQQMKKLQGDNAAALATKKLSREQLKQTLVAGKLSDAEAERAVKAYENAEATGVETTATQSYTLALWENIKATAQWLVTNPLGYLVMLVGAIAAVSSAWKIQQEALIQNAEESKSAYDEAQQSLDSLNSELEPTAQRIEELEAKDSLTIVEKEELKNLREQNDLLTSQKVLLQDITDIRQNQVEQDTKKAYEDLWGYDKQGGKNSNTDYVDSVDNLIDRINVLQGYVDGYKEKQAALDVSTERGARLFKEYAKKISYTEGKIAELKTTLADVATTLMQWKTNLEKAGPAFQPIIEAIDVALNAFNLFSNPKAGIQDFIDDSSYSSIMDKLSGMQDASEATAKAMGDSSEWDAFKSELEDAGYTIQDVIDYLNELDNTSVSPEVDPSAVLTLEDLNTQIDDLQSAYQTLDGVVTDYNKNGYLTFDNLQSLLNLGNEYLQYLTMENGQLSINTNGFMALANARIDDAEATYMQQAADLITKMMSEGSAAAYLASELSNLSGARLEDANAAYQEAYANAIASGSAEIVSATKQLGNTVSNTRKIFDQMRSSLGSYGSAMLGAASATSSAASTICSALSSINSLLSTTMAMLKQQYSDAADAQKEALNAEKEAVQDRYDAEKEAIESARDAAKERYDAQKQRLEDERDAYNDLIDAQIELLERQKEADD